MGGSSSEGIGDVLSGQTRIWAGPSFGLGLYRASNLSVAFTFDAERRGINDSLRLPPLPGQLVDAACALDDRRAWLLLALQHGGRTNHLCLVYSRAGALEASAEATAGDGSWLGTLRGKCATQGMLLAATDSGITRIDVRDGALEKTREFPDAEPFVDTACQLLAGKDGLYVVGRSQITALKMNRNTNDRRLTMTAHRPLPLPAVFDAKNAEKFEYAPDQQRLFADAAEWRRAHGITPAASDKRNIHSAAHRRAEGLLLPARARCTSADAAAAARWTTAAASPSSSTGT